MIRTGQRRLNESSFYSIVNCLTRTLNISDFGEIGMLSHVFWGEMIRKMMEIIGQNPSNMPKTCQNMPILLKNMHI
jgi:hypothetical protein